MLGFLKSLWRAFLEGVREAFKAVNRGGKR